jgi:hypothetical protein
MLNIIYSYMFLDMFFFQTFLAKSFKSMSTGIYHSMRASIVAISLLVSMNSFGADWWVAQSAAGSGSGADTNDCMALGWPSANPGDTVHLCGTLTNAMTIGGSGSAGNPITIHFEPNAKFSALTFPGANWVTVNGSWIVIDGGQNGLIENTSNGTVAANGGTMQYGNDGAGVAIPFGNNYIIVQNLAIRNMYQRQTNSELVQGSGDGNDIYCADVSSGLMVSNCVLGEALNGIACNYRPTLSSNITIIRCVFTNFNHGFTLGCGAVDSPVFDNLIIRSNVFDGGDMFETEIGQEFGLHRNPIFLFNESSDRLGCISNIEISYNFLRMGANPQSYTAGTGAMFFDFYNSNMAANVRVFNNISTLVYPLNWSGGGGFISGSGNGVLVANNTAVAWQSGGSYGGGQISLLGTNGQSFNNILISQKGAEAGTWADTSNFGSSTTNYAGIVQSFSGLHFDHNIYNGQSGYSEYQGAIFILNTDATWYNGQPDVFAYWQSWYGFDAHSTTATVQLGANFAPLPNDVVAIGNGTNLTAFGITNDFSGNPRPATGNWTIGAFEGPTAISAPQISAPQISVTPASQDFGMVAMGATTNQTFTVQNTGGGTLTGSVSVAAPLSIVSGGSYSLGAGQSQTVTVSYSPTATGTNAMTVTFSGGGGAGVTLAGMAVAPPVVSAITQSGANVDGNASGLQIFAGPVVQYSGSASDPNGLPLTWQWLYTLNGGPETAIQSGTGSVAAVAFNYPAGATGGNYVWILRAGNGYATNESTLAVVVEAAPAADAGYVYQAASGSVTAPFMVTNGSCYQSFETCVPTNDGQAVFTITITNAGYYVIQALVNAPDDANNSFFVNIDAQPQAPAMIWDIFPFTSGFEQRVVSWRGNGSDTNAQFAPMYFQLSRGLHQIIFRGREANTQLQSFSLLPAPPQNFRALAPGQ